MQAVRAIVSKSELEGLLAAPSQQVDQENAAATTSDVGMTEDAGRRMIEQAFHYWEQTVHDLQREVKALRDRIEQLERLHEDPQPVKLTLPEPPTTDEPGEARLSRTERHRKSRWF